MSSINNFYERANSIYDNLSSSLSLKFKSYLLLSESIELSSEEFILPVLLVVNTLLL